MIATLRLLVSLGEGEVSLQLHCWVLQIEIIRCLRCILLISGIFFGLVCFDSWKSDESCNSWKSLLDFLFGLHTAVQLQGISVVVRGTICDTDVRDADDPHNIPWLGEPGPVMMNFNQFCHLIISNFCHLSGHYLVIRWLWLALAPVASFSWCLWAYDGLCLCSGRRWAFT